MAYLSLYEFFSHKADQFSSRPYLYEDGSSALTYNESLALVEQFSEKFSERGIRKNDVVFVVSRNKTYIPVIIFALSKLGALFCIINPEVKPYGFKKICDIAEPALVLIEKRNKSFHNEDFKMPCPVKPITSEQLKYFHYVDSNWLEAQKKAENAFNVSDRHKLSRYIQVRHFHGKTICFDVYGEKRTKLVRLAETLGAKIIE